MDVECWKIIKKGDYLYLDDVKKQPNEVENLSEAKLKDFEMNHKALRYLVAGLGDSDKRKVLVNLIAKEKWDALEKIHFGSEDVKQDRIAALTNCKVHNFKILFYNSVSIKMCFKTIFMYF